MKAVSIWGWQDDPSLEDNNYSYSMNGPYCGLFTELYAVKDSFKNVYEVLANKKNLRVLTFLNFQDYNSGNT